MAMAKGAFPHKPISHNCGVKLYSGSDADIGDLVGCNPAVHRMVVEADQLCERLQWYQPFLGAKALV